MEQENLVQLVRDRFSKMFEEDKKIEGVYRKIRRGVATYEDAHVFSLEVGRLMRRTLEDLIDVVPEGFDYSEIADTIVEKAMTQNYRLTSLVCETVQDELNSLAGIGMKAMAPEINAARIGAVQEALTAAETAYQAKVAIGESVITFTEAVVDDWVKTNAEFQKLSGMEPVLARKWSGRYGSHDTKHTDWCKDLEGVWEYGNHPSRVFARHEGCRCTVMYYPDKGVPGRITALAKGEKDVDGVLWNTGAVFSNSRQAQLRRRRQQYGREEARKILNEEWAGGRNGQAERHFK